MQTITLKVDNSDTNDIQFLKDLLKRFHFITEITLADADEEPVSKEQFKADLKEALEDVKEMQAGRKSKTTLNEFLNEL